MSRTVTELPGLQLGPLQRGYDDAVAARRRQTLIGVAVLLAAITVAGVVGEVDPARFVANIHRLPDYVGRIFTLENGRPVWTDPVEWMWGLDLWLKLLGETILIAYLGTAVGALLGFVLCFVASANLVHTTWLRATARRLLEICRTVPELVFALIFVQAFGLGPLPGVLAIAIHTIGALGKLFAEVVENIDMKPVEGVVACGGTWTESIRFAVLPQVMSNFVSYALLRFEINVRGAAVMGFVGAGGIGQDLLESIRKFYYADVSALLVLIIVTVMLIDLGTERVRHALIGNEARS
jgi:phosphonate transport system permease protein